MPIAERAAALRAAMESALEQPVHMQPSERGYRIHSSAPDGIAPGAWADLLTALRSADYWGSTDTAGVPQVWAEVEER